MVLHTHLHMYDVYGVININSTYNDFLKILSFLYSL